MSRTLFCVCLLLWAVMVYSQAEFGNFMDREDYENCYQGLQSADADANNVLTSEEFVDFAQFMAGSGLLENVTIYADLPAALQQAFMGVACLCTDASLGYTDDENCCAVENASIRIPIASSVDDLSAEERLYLYAACSYTATAAESISDTTNPLGTPLWPVSPTASPIGQDEEPTASPTDNPTEEPSPKPTKRPTRIPTERPSEEGQNEEPTSSPSEAIAPTNSPSATKAPAGVGPTGTPTVQQTAAPSELAFTELPTSPSLKNVQKAHVAYYFQAPQADNGGNMSDILVSYLSDLQVAMNRLAPQVVIHDTSEVQWNAHDYSLRRRSLQAASVLLPTSFANMVKVDCSPNLSNSSSSICHWVLAVIPLEILDSNLTSEDVKVLVRDFESRLSEAVAAGRLQDELLKVNPDSPVTVYVEENNGSTSPSPTPEPANRSAPTGLSPGAISGIAVAGAVVLLIPLVVICVRSSRKDKDKDKRKPGSFYVGEPEELGPTLLADADDEQPSSPPGSPAYQSRHVAPPDVAELSNTQPILYKPGLSVDDQDEESNIVVPTEEPPNVFEKGEQQLFMGGGSTGDDEDEASSGDWSSSDGVTSLNRARDVEGGMAIATGVTIAAATAATVAAQPRAMHDEETPLLNVSTSEADSSVYTGVSEDEEVSSNPLSSTLVKSPQSQLESQIDAEDWAAVGATAALLAAASDSQSGTTSAANSRASRASRSSGGKYPQDEAKRAAELDRLVDQGDWDGLIVAASRYEAASAAAAPAASDNNNISSTVSSPRTGSSVSSGSVASGSDTGTGTIGSPSYDTTASDSLGRSQRRSELRSEVEALVRRVVPEEIDNVDEMMNQFSGREEELVETLRNMQERSVAQKARAAKQKAAKVDARRSVQRGTVPGAQDVLSKSGDSESEAAEEDVRTEDAALAAGASAAAALLGHFPSPGSESHESPIRSENESLDNRRSALEAAIDAGDWQAVGDAAAMLSDVSFASASTSDLIERYADLNASGYSEGSGHRARALGSVDALRAEELDALVERRDWAAVMEATRRFRKEDETKPKGPSKEEEEALQQAELWRQIAEQNQPGATDAGASSAAEWAIQRSLSQLNEAEKMNAPSGDSGEV